MSNTKKIRVLLYKAKWGDKSIIDNLISIRTWSKYSHVELWTPDVNGHFNVNEYCNPSYNKPKGTCWTSTMRGKDNGTVKRDASGVLKNPERWDYIEIEVVVGNYNYDCLMGYMETEVINNKGYSKWDILKFVSPWHFDDKDRNICSEFVNNALVHARVLVGLGIVSPKKVYKKLIAKGYKVKELK